MALTNKLQKVVDRPVWEWCRFNPVGNTASGGVLCTSDDGTGRYMYYLQALTFYRYDTWTDSWQTLAPPLVTGGTVSSALKYSIYGGYRGRVLATGTNTPATIKVSGLANNILAEKTDNSAVKVRIMSGTGAGQERTVTAVSANTIEDFGVATGGSTATVVDSTKLWKFNQWRGYQVRITFGTGLGQVRKILYNDQTTLTVSAVNHQSIEPWANALFTVAPAAASNYVIESAIVTVDTNWTTIPDTTSQFVFMTGGIWFLTTAATPGWSYFAYYDIHSDVWLPKTVLMGNTSAALGTDWAIERTGEVGSAFVGPLAATNAGSNTIRTFTDTAASWTVNQWVGYQLRISLGTAMGTRRRIIGNTATTITVQRAFDVTPGATDTYSILGDTDKIYLSGNAGASMYQYSIENDLWSYANAYDWGTARIASVQLKASSSMLGSEPIALTSIAYNATGMLTAPVTTAGSGYTRASIGVIVTVAGTTGGTVMITGVTSGGGVASVEIVNAGTSCTAGAQTLTGGVGTGAQCTITVGKVGLATTAIIHNLKTGDPIKIIGDESAETYWNGDFTVLGVSSTTVFSIAANASASVALSATAHSATLLRDPSQQWTVDEHKGKIVMTYQTPTAPGLYTIAATCCATKILSNSATALTITTGTVAAATNGTTRYVIMDNRALGKDDQYRTIAQSNDGYVTSAGATSLTDSTKAWFLNQWVGYTVRIVSGTGLANGDQAITASNATSITVASWASATPDTTSQYVINDTFGTVTTGGSTTVITDATKNWVASSLVGKRVKLTAGVNAGVEQTISANTSNTFTVGTITSTTTNMMYSILGRPAAGAAHTLQWAYNPSKWQKGRYLVSARGATPYFDIYDICKNSWDFQALFTPQTEILASGSMYAYDGKDRLYFTIAATGRVMYLDLATGMIMGSSQTPYAHGVATVGNKMEIVSTADDLDYIYIMRHTGAEMWRTLAFWSGW